MTRTILFRGKSKDNSEWVDGDLIERKCDGIQKYYIYDNFYDETEIIEYNEDAEKTLKNLFYEVIPETVGQYIGREDKNRNKIFEGDFVKIDGYGIKGIYLIFWDENTASFSIENYNDDVFEHSATVMEVIGNKFDNPELIK